MIAGMLWIVIRSQPCLREFSSICRLHSFYRYTRSNSNAFLKVKVHSNGNVTGIAFTGKRSERLYTGKDDSDIISLFLVLLLLFFKIMSKSVSYTFVKPRSMLLR